MFAFEEDEADDLEVKLAEWRVAYEKGTPLVPDEVYDAGRDRLRALRPESPEVQAIGATPVSEWAKVSHGVPMGSLDKIGRAHV